MPALPALSLIIGHCPATALAVIRTPSFIPTALGRFLFEPQWVAQIGAALVAILLIVQGIRTTNSRLRQLGIGLLGLVVLWVIAGIMVVTPAERLLRAHERLLAAVEQRDSGALTQLLRPEFTWGQMGRDAVVNRTMSLAGSVPVNSSSIRAYDAFVTRYDAESNLAIDTRTAFGTIPTKWHFTWYDTPESDWQLSSVREWELEGVPQPDGPPRASMLEIR